MSDLILTGVCYFFFNRVYFHFMNVVLQKKCLRYRLEFLFFIINYSFFIVCSLFQLQLVHNWMAFGVFLFLETVYCIKNVRQAAFFAMNGVICGLTVNIISRCLFALFLNVPLTSFNNNITQIGNIKVYPIMIGFLVGAAVLRYFSNSKRSDLVHFVFNYQRQLQFLCNIMILMLFCLLLHLLLYNHNENAVMLKLWGIWSCIFVFYAYYLALNYTIRICQNMALNEQNLKLKAIVDMQIQEEEELSDEVYHDELTGLYNRSYAQNILSDLLEKHRMFSLCFVDLDGLKLVNDKLGHSIGDKYILEISQQLLQLMNDQRHVFRIGGDEFLLILEDLSVLDAETQLEDINHQLANRHSAYDMSISYGVVYSNDHMSRDALIAAADERMYQHKKMKNMQRK